MRLDNPFALLLLLLIPLLLFMRRKRTRARLPVANLYLWQESATRDVNTLARRIRRDWLLILQAAFLVVVAFAMARPVVADSHRSVVVVFDTSLSMGARDGSGSRLDLAKARAADLLGQLSRGARLRVVGAANTAIAGPFAASDREALTAVRSIQITDGHDDLAAAIERARESGPAPDRIYVFSDIEAARIQPRPPDLDWITVGSRADNAALTVLSARPSISQPGQLQILISVANHGAAPLEAIVRLTRDAAEVTQQAVNVGPRSTGSYSFDLSDAAGVLEARLDHSDALAADNVRRLIIPAPARIWVRLTSPPGFFLEKALAAHPEFVVATSNADADVIVCDHCSTLPDGRAGVLMTAPASGSSAAATLARVNTDHPIADGLDIDGDQALLHPVDQDGPAQPSSAEAPEGRPADGTVIALANGKPALFAHDTGARRIVDVRVDVDMGPFPLSPGFPVLIANAIRWLAARDTNPTTVNAGEPVRWHVNDGDPGSGIGDQRQVTPVVAGPDGQTLPSTLNGGILSFTQTGTAGVYRIRLGDTQHAVVVNPVADGESNLEESLPPASLATPARASNRERQRNIAVPLLLAALFLLALEWRHQWRARIERRRLTVARLAVASLVVLALVGVTIVMGHSPLSVLFLVDRSHSMSASPEDTQRRLTSLASRLERDDRAGVVVFGAVPVVERALGPASTVGGQIAATVSGTATDLEAAIRLARNTLPRDGARRIVVLSDGNETRGDAVREASRAAADGIAIDAAVPAQGPSTPRLIVSRLSAPVQAAVDQPFAITASVEGPPGHRGELLIQDDAGTSVRREVRLGADGAATETLTTREREPGLRVYRASIRSLDSDFDPDVVEASAGALVSISGRPRVLIVGRPPGRLDASLGQAYDVRHTGPDGLPRSATALNGYDAIVLDDVGQEALDTAQISALAQHVETRGAGLLVLGSPRTLDATVVPDAGLGRLLPVDVRPRAGVRAPELALVVVVDKSGSMDERVDGVARIDFARQSIRRVLEAVPATDAVGVIAFDRTPSIVAPLQSGHDPRAIAEQLRTVAAAGATEIAPAVDLARQWLAAYPTARRHILLVSDGRSSPADSERLQALVRDGRFRLSVISLGGDRDRQFLSALASAAGGRSYFPDDERELPSIAAREAARVAGGRVVEEVFTPRTSTHPILNALDPRAMPRLNGYIVTAARQSAEVVLSSHRDDPIVAAWQYGVGRVAVYTADLSSTWSAALRQSPLFAPFLQQTVRWLARRQPDDSLYARLQASGDSIQITLDAQSADAAYVTGLIAQANVQPPTGEPVHIDLVESAPGRYEGQIPVSDTGEFVVSLTARSRDGRFDARTFRGFFWSGDKEYRSTGVNRALLSQLTSTTGGTLIDGDADPFLNRPRAYRDVTTWLLGAAFLLFLGELIAPGLVALGRSVSRRPTPENRAAA